MVLRKLLEIVSHRAHVVSAVDVDDVFVFVAHGIVASLHESSVQDEPSFYDVEVVSFSRFFTSSNSIA